MSDHLIGIIDKTKFEQRIENIEQAIVMLVSEIREMKALLLDLKVFENMNDEL